MDNYFRTFILALAVALFSIAAAQFRMVFFKRKTLQDVLSDPKTYITGTLGIILYIFYQYLINQTIHHL